MKRMIEHIHVAVDNTITLSHLSWAIFDPCK